jgi:hypothetical protein
MQRCFAGLLAIMLAGGCAAPNEPLPITPPAEVRQSAVARRPLEAPATRPGTQVPQTAAPTGALPPGVSMPPDTLYVCVSETGGQRRHTAIEFAPKVGALCKRHPEMGPCQYERDICRRSGGRVYAASGQEITPQIEAEYDKKVLRVRFRAN